MNSHELYPIGELARRTGSPVRTIRFYSDHGILPPAGRTPAGYRLYDEASVARLELVRTLRDLGLDLEAVRKVVDRELSLPQVAAAHAEALDVQIRVLRLRRTVLAAVAERGATPEETRLMHRLARLSEAERQRLVDDFLDAAFGGVSADPAFAGIRRSMTPELPEDPGPEQVRAWVELAELSQDPGFRAHVRHMAEELAAGRAHSGPGPSRGLAVTVGEQVAPAVAAGTEPDSPRADPVVSALLARCAPLLCTGGGEGAARRELLARLEGMNDPRRERYFALLAVVNGWPRPESPGPVLDWAVQALRARVGQP
ncbi:MerR family transcriptional regulator [Streptomyces sp. NBC_00249]|uniref:MerR family transcriptional regulator n=1 Tax=Streptomyces sp. NBC_00249 TaxID=2975690 RepID=UPI0022545D9E|nr:MerR family transcriptional regulator [Streptomyces sp. NBC_00249]MCX5199242.1 MerR family transcriptional regulator [Streptomyces sp. NBC_00249]